MMEASYLIAIVFMLTKISMISIFVILQCLVRVDIDGECVVPLALAVITMRGAMFHP
jgi:hypothetical protein